MSVVAGDLSACSLAEALSARATRSEESKIHGPHEYYMQHIVPVRGVRVKYLPSSTMVYSCTCAWLQNPEAPLVCARLGFAVLMRIPQILVHTMRCNLSNSQSTTTVTDYPRNGRARQHYR